MATTSFSELQKMQAEILQSLADIKDIKAMDGLMTKLKKVKEEIGKFEEERKDSIADLNNLITMYEVKLSELSVEVQKILQPEPAAQSEEGATARKARAPNKPKGAYLIILPKIGTRGATAAFTKGQKIGSNVSPRFKALYEADKANFESELKKHFTEEGKQYFGTAEGAAVLKAYVEAVKTKKAQPVNKKK